MYIYLPSFRLLAIVSCCRWDERKQEVTITGCYSHTMASAFFRQIKRETFSHRVFSPRQWHFLSTHVIVNGSRPPEPSNLPYLPPPPPPPTRCRLVPDCQFVNALLWLRNRRRRRKKKPRTMRDDGECGSDNTRFAKRSPTAWWWERAQRRGEQGVCCMASWQLANWSNVPIYWRDMRKWKYVP